MLTIGMPVFRGERFIEVAIRSLLEQTFENWQLVISDNASDDRTQEICEGYARSDRRVRYVRHGANMGAVANFAWVLRQADTPYFMWAAADDLWHPEFAQQCIDALTRDPGLGMAFSNLDVIDSFGQVVRRCHDMTRFAGRSGLAAIARFVWDEEILAKANLIYSVFRTDVCRRAMARAPMDSSWGCDMAFVLAALAEVRVAVRPQVLFCKRDARASDIEGHPQQIQVPQRLQERAFPLTMYQEYHDKQVAAVASGVEKALVSVLMRVRRFRLARATRRAGA